MAGHDLSAGGVSFDVWGRGDGRDARPGGSVSCCSLLEAPELLVLDAGRGLAALVDALHGDPRFAAVERVSLLVSGSHPQHWEGLEDARWFRDDDRRPPEVTLVAAPETLAAVRDALAERHPELVRDDAAPGMGFSPVAAGDSRTIGPWRLLALPLDPVEPPGGGASRPGALRFRLEHPAGVSVTHSRGHVVLSSGSGELSAQVPMAPAVAPGAADGDGLRALRHELKTPINQILGFAELIQEELEDNGNRAHHDDLDKIRVAASKLLESVEGLRGTSLSGGGAALPAPHPAAGGEGAPAPALRVPSSTVAAAGTGRERAVEADHILVVDDNELNRDMLSRRLASRGYRVSTAADGYLALDVVAAGGVDAVLLDVMMPGISGIQVLETLRQTWAASDLPVIMATARDNSEDIVEALRAGANDYVTKPLDFPVVLARLSTQLTLKKAKARADRLAQELEIRNAFIRRTFGRYLSDDVVATLLETPEGLELGGERRTVTILMSDLRGFTALTNDLAPEQVMHVLNTYLGRMTEIVNRHRGTIDEFIGDAVLALFGAPGAGDNDALRAVLCALEMQLAMADVNESLASAGLPQVEMGIGLNTGEVVAGNIGSEARTKYGIVGGQVNLTSRVESFTVGGQILLTEATRRAAGPAVRVGKTMALNAKGFHEPVTVHELLGLGEPYNLSLASADDVVVPLARPAAVRCWVLAEKLIDSDSFPAAMTGLTARGALLRAEGRPALLANLRVRILGDPETAATEIYAKVSDLDPADGELFFVRFTSLRPEMRKRLAALPQALGPR